MIDLNDAFEAAMQMNGEDFVLVAGRQIVLERSDKKLFAVIDEPGSCIIFRIAYRSRGGELVYAAEYVVGNEEVALFDAMSLQIPELVYETWIDLDAVIEDWFSDGGSPRRTKPSSRPGEWNVAPSRCRDGSSEIQVCRD